MTDPAQLSVKMPDGSDRNIIIEPVLKQDDQNLYKTGVYNVYKDAIGDESVLFTEPLEINKSGGDLPDNKNPDFLGKFTITTNMDWEYEGDLLSVGEQNQVIEFIRNYHE